MEKKKKKDFVKIKFHSKLKYEMTLHATGVEFKFNWIEFKFHWKEMGCKLVKNMVLDFNLI